MRMLARLLVAASLVLGSRAGALDLTGIWLSTLNGDTKCRYFDGIWKKTLDANLGTIGITQVGTTMYLEIRQGSADAFNNKFKGLVVEASNDPEKGVASATACKVDGENYHGVYSIRKAQADATRGTMSVEFFGTNIGVPLFCKTRFERISSGDPGVTQTCP